MERTRSEIREVVQQIKDLMPSPMKMSLRKAQRWFAKKIIHKRTDCPCCGRSGKANAHFMTVELLRLLGWMYKIGGKKSRKWVDVKNAETTPRWVLKNRQWHKLNYWGLVRRRSNTDPKRHGSGQWKVTKKGRAFLRSKPGSAGRIPFTVYIFKKEVVDTSDEKIAPVEVDETFDFKKWMRTSWLHNPTRKTNRN